MRKALLSHHAPQGVATTAVMARMVAWALCVGSLLGLPACTGINHQAETIEHPRTVDKGGTGQFPSNAHLRRTTVSLRMVGFTFGSGLALNQHGKPTGNGVELVPHQWCGSGFVIGQDGTIVTNYHVARRAVRGHALFDGGAQYAIAHLKVYDPANDLAVLKINATDPFAAAQLGDANVAEVRDSVLAAGNGLCEGLSLTEGKVSMFQKDARAHLALLVHTAPIAPGNSGGPLYKDERVIGINVQEASGHQRGYAIPINKLRPLLDAKYEKRALYLQDVFPSDPLLIATKAHPILEGSGQVKAASHQDPGLWSTRVDLRSLEDYAILVQTSSKNNLDLVIYHNNAQLIGLGTSRSVQEEVVFLSSPFDQRVTIHVVNPAPVPVTFELSVHNIRW